MTRRPLPAPWRVGAVVVFVVAGGLFVTSSLDADGLDLRAASVTDLDTVVRQQAARTDALQQQVEGLAGEVDALGQDVGDRDVRRLREAVDELRGPAGFTAVSGPAVTVTLEDAPAGRIEAAVAEGSVTPDQLVVHQQDIQAVANALWLGGAEAMTLQDQRVVSTTGIKCVGNTVILQGVPYAPPYRITAIGDPGSLLQALQESEYVAGYRTYVEAYGLGYDVEVEEEALAPAFTGAAELRHAVAQAPEGAARP